jgi:hypothetical protein
MLLPQVDFLSTRLDTVSFLNVRSFARRAFLFEGARGGTKTLETLWPFF